MSDMLFGWVTKFFPGMKTYIAGFGLVGLGIYEMTQQHTQEGMAHIGEGLGLIGIRSALPPKV